MIAIANLAIYMATIDYMVAAYGEYAASATGGNVFARDLLACAAAMYSVPLLGKHQIQTPVVYCHAHCPCPHLHISDLSVLL